MIAAKTDTLQKSIVELLRKAGASVQVLSGVGRGCPDIAAGFRGVNLFFEVKSKRGKLTPDQIAWHQIWRGKVHIVRSVMDVVKVLENIK